MSVNPPPLDLVGGSFAVIESDPGVFTSLTRRLGIHGLELVEMYDIEPWAVDHLNPHGLIFCFMWRKDAHRPADFDDPAAERVWFANQLSDDACATHAILNVLLNCPGIDVGDELKVFRQETEQMSPVMRGLAVTNSPVIRRAHNSLARPSDIRASLNNITITTFDVEKRKEKERLKAKHHNDSQPSPAKRARLTKSTTITNQKPKPTRPVRGRPKGKGKAKETDDTDLEETEKEDEEEEEEEETYHFIGYVPAHGKVWELDGLKSGPLEVGELPHPVPGPSHSHSQPTPNDARCHWMDTVRPALRMKMEKYGGSGTDGSNIRFSLLAIVDDGFRTASDELEFLKRERLTLERRLGSDAAFVGWEAMADPSLVTPPPPPGHGAVDPGRTYAPDFGARKMERDMQILRMSTTAELVGAWEASVRNAMRARVGVEDELAKGVRANTEHVKRTFDYEPFIREYLRALHREGLLNPLLDRDEHGRKKKKRKAAGKAVTNEG